MKKWLLLLSLLFSSAAFAGQNITGNLTVSGNTGLGTTTTGNAALYVTSGNVGIGTINPNNLLCVGSTCQVYASSSGIVSTTNYFLSQNGYASNSTGSLAAPAFRINTTNSGGMFFADNNTPVFTNGTTETMRITSAGNVGINTAAPNAKLNIGSGQIAVPDGDVTTPGYGYTGATNTGFYRATTSVGLTVAGTSALIFTRVGTNGQISGASGNTVTLNSTANGGHIILLPTSGANVGIGTAIPIASLEVVGTVNIDKAGTGAGLSVYPYGLAVGNTGLFGVSGANNASVVKMYDTSQNQQVQIHGAGVSYFNGGNVGIGTTTPQGALVVTNGNVGIGTWAPMAKLEIMGNAAAYASASAIQLSENTGSSSRNWLIGNASGPNYGDLAFHVSTTQGGAISSTPKIVFTSTGSVGIGTTTPAGALTVMNGSVGIGTWVPNQILSVTGLGSATINLNAAPSGQGGIDANAILMAHFDGSSSTFTDSSNSPLTMTGVGSGVQSATSPKFGAARYSGDGVNGSYITVGGVSTFNFMHNTTAKFTVDWWMKPSNFTNQQYIYNDASNASNVIGATVTLATDRTMELYISNGTGGAGATVVDCISSAYPNDTSAYHSVAVTYDQSLSSNNCTWYIDGVVSGQTTKGAATPSNSNSGQQPELFARASDNNKAFIGSVDELRISNSIRYSGAYTPATAPYDTSNLTTSPKLQFQGLGTNLWSIYNDGSVSNFLKFNNGSDRVTIDNSGNIGVGTTTPAGALTVMNGNVGIGTWVPSSPLTIKGATVMQKLTGANTACSTTCGAFACYFGEDTGVLGTLLDCADATADVCFCSK